MRPNWFIGFPVGGEDWYQAVTRPPPGLRRFHPLDLHITIAFLGGVNERSARTAWHALGAVSSHQVTLGRLQRMGRAKRYAALAASLEDGRQKLEEEILRVRPAILQAAGIAANMRQMNAHLTLARPMRRATPHQRQQGWTWAQSLNLESVPVFLDQVALYTWDEERKSRLFQVVEHRWLTR